MALRAALESFWRHGYAATSLDHLTSAMGISRSSFYGSFGSKHSVLLEVLEVYTSELLARMQDAVASASDPRSAVLAVLQIVACTGEPAHGCLFANSATELLPADAEVAELAKRYLGEVDQRVAGLLREMGFTPAESRSRSGAMLALATGAITL
ncbi:MAG: TetR/AcrR family transcriptional regulator, partial [Pseudomonadota bacterium]|nr:TetR/AcrR family transcriptional regulator [Pseudomonadota bacterium]